MEANEHTPIPDAELDEMWKMHSFDSDGKSHSICRLIAEVRALRKNYRRLWKAADDFLMWGNTILDDPLACEAYKRTVEELLEAVADNYKIVDKALPAPERSG